MQHYLIARTPTTYIQYMRNVANFLFTFSFEVLEYDFPINARDKGKRADNVAEFVILFSLCLYSISAQNKLVIPPRRFISLRFHGFKTIYISYPFCP